MLNIKNKKVVNTFKLAVKDQWQKKADLSDFP